MKKPNRQNVRVALIDRASLYEIPDKLTEVIGWLASFLSQVPEEYRKEVCIDFDRNYSDDTTEFSIYYYRPETDEELRERKDRTKAISESIKNKELAELARLREKYNV